jgi:3-phosphoglycerate kinase
LIENMLDKVNKIIICGGMAFTFKKTIDGVKVSIIAAEVRVARILNESDSTDW